MEDHGGLVGILGEHLLHHIQKHRQEHHCRDDSGDLRPEPELRKLLGQRSGDILKDTHLCEGRVAGAGGQLRRSP